MRAFIVGELANTTAFPTKGTHMGASPKLSAVAIACASAFSAPVWASGTAITIYSTLRPGAVPPELSPDAGERGQAELVERRRVLTA